MTYALIVIFILLLLVISAFTLVRFREAVRIGSDTGVLTPEERLRVSLALRNMEIAEGELLKVTALHANVNSQLGGAVLDLNELSYRLRRLLREQ